MALSMVQRAGRAVRDPGLNGLYLAMIEPWALESSLGEDDQDTDGPTDDPDRPWAGTVKKNSSKQDRTGLAALRFAQSEVCLRQFLGEYLDDQSPGGDSGHSDGNSILTKLIASLYTAPWCCDRHENTFDLSFFFMVNYTQVMLRTR
jgi:hypothetical protein